MDRDLIPTRSGELWMGGRPGITPDDGLQSFDLFVNATYELPDTPAGAAVYVRLPLDDSDLDDEDEAERVRAVASLVAGALTMGWRVFVHCNMGLNRSGVTCARALMYMGSTAPEAVATVRENRMANRREWFATGALFNTEYVRWLEREDGIYMPDADTSMFNEDAE